MGHHCSSVFIRGHYSNSNMKFLVIAAILATVSADPYYGHQWQWPSSYGLGYSGPCWGCRGKRSAEPEPFYGYGGYGGGLAHHAYGGSSYVGRTIWGLRGKRSADPEAYYGGYGYGYGHGYGGYGGYGGLGGYGGYGGYGHGYSLGNGGYAHFS